MRFAAALNAAFLLLSTVLRAAETPLVQASGTGSMQAFFHDDSLHAVTTDIRIALPGWVRVGAMSDWSVADVTYREQSGRRIWSGRIAIEGGLSCLYTQTVTEAHGQARFEIALTPEKTFRIEGAYFFLRVPIRTYRGGRCTWFRAEDNGPRELSTLLPAAEPPNPRLAEREGDTVALTPGTSGPTLLLSLHNQALVELQDERRWSSDTYALYTRFADERLEAGKTIVFRATLAMAGPSDRGPVEIDVTPVARYRIDGFGGNFVFGVDAPVTRYNLDNLHVRWARTRMNLRDWEPRNDNDSPSRASWSRFAAADQPGTELRTEFEFARLLQQRNIPNIVSVWYLPPWMLSDPQREKDAFNHRVAEGQMPEVVEGIVTYLMHAKRVYGVEPAMFSFNEAREGVHVHFSAEEHRDLIGRLGDAFQRSGLRTRLLLADNGSPRDSLDYATPAIRDPQTMRYVAGLSFHTWHGARPDQYSAWGDLAERLGVPLIVGEVGVDSAAWQRPWVLDSLWYAMREVSMYQDLLTHARPQVLLQWELTEGYGPTRWETPPGGSAQFQPTHRFWLLKHFFDLTPPGATALQTLSDRDDVQVTAFARPLGSSHMVYALHIANHGAGRHAVIRGLPRSLRAFGGFRTDAQSCYAPLSTIILERGTARIELPPLSLVTLIGKADRPDDVEVLP